MTATLILRVDVDAPVEHTWAGATDWAWSLVDAWLEANAETDAALRRSA